MKTVYYDGDTFERGGILFRVNIENDDTGNAPWENEDGHGPVSDWTTRDKRPGEWVLNSDRGSKRFYDAAEANRIAKRDQWGIGPEAEAELLNRLRGPRKVNKKRLGVPDPTAPIDPPPLPLTAGEIRAEAVRRDFEYLRGWCADQWCYVGVIVTPIPRDAAPDEAPTDYANALWGIESDAYEYLAEVAHNLADEVISQRRETWRKALAEARAARYWASRDIVTV